MIIAEILLTLFIFLAVMLVVVAYYAYTIGTVVGRQRQLNQCCEDLLKANMGDQIRHLSLVK